MIKIIDRTLSCLDDYELDNDKMIRLLDLLIEAGADYIELSQKAYKCLGKLNEKGKYILRINFPDEINEYKEFNSFVCRRSDIDSSPAIAKEIQINDVREVNNISMYSNLKKIRINGLDDILNYNYEAAFKQLISKFKGKIELCPENKYFSATAISTEWILSGGTDIVTSFYGINGFAPFEEVMLALRIIKRYKPSLSFSMFPEIKSIIESITLKKTENKKAVIGKDIFAVEAGIHVNGISKEPKIYEPFSPDLVGNKRSIVLGKHSGKKSVILKLIELNIDYSNINICDLLLKIKQMSIEKNRSIFDDEFKMLLSS